MEDAMRLFAQQAAKRQLKMPINIYQHLAISMNTYQWVSVNIYKYPYTSTIAIKYPSTMIITIKNIKKTIKVSVNNHGVAGAACHKQTA